MVACCYDNKYSKPVQIYRGENAVHKLMGKMLEKLNGAKKLNISSLSSHEWTKQKRGYVLWKKERPSTQRDRALGVYKFTCWSLFPIFCFGFRRFRMFSTFAFTYRGQWRYCRLIVRLSTWDVLDHVLYWIQFGFMPWLYKTKKI